MLRELNEVNGINFVGNYSDEQDVSQRLIDMMEDLNCIHAGNTRVYAYADVWYNEDETEITDNYTIRITLEYDENEVYMQYEREISIEDGGWKDALMHNFKGNTVINSRANTNLAGMIAEANAMADFAQVLTEVTKVLDGYLR